MVQQNCVHETENVWTALVLGHQKRVILVFSLSPDLSIA